MTNDEITEEDVCEAFQTILNADKQVLANHHTELHHANFSDSSAVHCESDLRAWMQQQFIKDVLGHLYGVPPKLRIQLGNPGETEV